MLHSEEQNLGVQQVNEAINQLNITTQQNASLAENLSSNAEVFNNMAEALQKTISFFQLPKNN